MNKLLLPLILMLGLNSALAADSVRVLALFSDKALVNINGKQQVIKKGQELMVEVIKEMPGRKGAHLTTYLSLAGRFLVLTPGKTVNGISRKIDDEKERQRLKSIMDRIKLPDDVGYIVRTVAAGRNKRELSRDLNRLYRDEFYDNLHYGRRGPYPFW